MRRPPHERPGLFIVFEGVDGSGKSTQLAKLWNYLRQNSALKLFSTKEPGATDAGQCLRQILQTYQLAPLTELLLMMADRIEHIPVILTHLQNKEIVLCDRYELSTIAYQGEGLGLISEVCEINKIVDRPVPDMTFILDVPFAVAWKRLKSRQGKVLYDTNEKILRKAAAAYSYISRQESLPSLLPFGYPMTRIDGTDSSHDVWEQIAPHVDSMIEKKKAGNLL